VIAYLALDRYLNAQGARARKRDDCEQTDLGGTSDPAVVLDAVRELGFEAAPLAPAIAGGQSRSTPAAAATGRRLVNGLVAQLRPSSC
jgi:hypothetical protein